jgi:hypothetical protein
VEFLLPLAEVVGLCLNLGEYINQSKTSSYTGTTKRLYLWSGREAQNFVGG